MTLTVKRSTVGALAVVGAALVGGAFISGLLGFAALSAPSTATYESQAWWRLEGISVPDAVGAHVHVKATVPVDGTPIDGKVAIPIVVTLHNARGALTWFRMGTESKYLMPATNLSTFNAGNAFGPCSDCTLSFTANVDFTAIPTGRHELRMSANNPDEDPDLTGAQRMFQSTGYQVCVRSCTPTYRANTPSIEARGWYTDHAYANASLTSAHSSVTSGGTISVKLGPGSGGKPTKFAGVYIDPSFHAGSAGITVKTWAAAFRGSVTLPTIAPGEHRLVLVSSDGQSAGVLSIPFTVPG